MRRLENTLRGLAVVVASACASNTVIVDGIKVREDRWNRTVSELERRVAFDLDCAPWQVKFRLREQSERVPTSVGAVGCDKRGTYLREAGPGGVGAWVLRLEKGQASENRITPPPPAPPAPAAVSDPVEPPPVP